MAVTVVAVVEVVAVEVGAGRRRASLGDAQLTTVNSGRSGGVGGANNALPNW